MRQEYKYLVPIERLDELRSALSPFVKVDPFADNREGKEYTVRSIYFDSIELADYFDKIEGYKIRKKIRIRGYNEVTGEEKIVYLEIKRKSETFNSKNRAPLLYSHLKEMIRTGDVEKYVLPKNKQDKKYDKNTNDAKKFCYHLYMKTLRPIVLVVYDREPFFSHFDKRIRLTFDKDLRFLAYPAIDDLYEDKLLRPAMTKFFIFEVKFDLGLPRWLQSILTRFDLRRQALSKYAICFDTYRDLTPIHKHNKYAFTNSKFLEWEDNYY